MYICIHTYIHTCISIYTYAYIHIYIHTYPPAAVQLGEAHDGEIMAARPGGEVLVITTSYL